MIHHRVTLDMSLLRPSPNRVRVPERQSHIGFGAFRLLFPADLPIFVLIFECIVIVWMVSLGVVFITAEPGSAPPVGAEQSSCRGSYRKPSGPAVLVSAQPAEAESRCRDLL